MRTDRRDFLKYGLITSSIFVGALYGIDKIKKHKHSITYTGELLDNSQRGHQLRNAVSIQPTHFEKQPVLIVGGGMTGLIAGYYLKQSGFTNFKIIELNSYTGGNSSFGENAVSKYPWGAHYIPLPNRENSELLNFFKAMGLATTNVLSGKTEFADEYICQDPQERLLIKGEWQESILPVKNISEVDQNQFDQFHQIVNEYKGKKGRDGKFIFDIPVMESSQDPQYLKLDSLSFHSYITQKGLDSDVLNWYLNYCTLDDFGMGIETVSAWAGLHYFCSRRAFDNSDDHKIMTWPQGNGWVLEQLLKSLNSHILVNHAAVRIGQNKNSHVTTLVYNFDLNQVSQYESENVIFSAPKFLAPYVITDLDMSDAITADDYYSWVVANVTVRLPMDKLNDLHWDNVRYGSASLGYVHARHQELRSHTDNQTVLTLYWPLFDKTLTATQVRKKIAGRNWNDWAYQIASELEVIHPGINQMIQNIDIKVHGHGMIGPRVGRMNHVFRKKTEVPLKKGQIIFAHTDNSGMSLFEEAHYWGHKAAQEILNRG